MRSRIAGRRIDDTRETGRPFAICVNNSGYETSLILRKVYEVFPDEAAAADDFIRIVDETDEDYLYDKSRFIMVEIPSEVANFLLSCSENNGSY
jgi:hypothetical protein